MLGWMRVTRRVVSGEFPCPTRTYPKMNRPMTVSSGKIISACQTNRRCGFPKMARRAENSERENHVTRNEMP